MLRELHIEDFAIIDELHLTLEPRFNILTGETGAGKSILIDAVTLILGERADTTSLRQGAESGRVEGMFVLSPALQATVGPILEREGLEGDAPDTLWLARELRSSGRTVARVNGRAASVSLLREIAEKLVDVHGQTEHLSLLRVREHLSLLDRFARLEPLAAQVAEIVAQVRVVRRELSQLLGNERERMQRMDLLRFQVEEITGAALRPGEKEALEAELTRLTNAEQLATLASGIVARLEEGGERSVAILDLLGRSQKDMAALVRIDGSLEPQRQVLDEIGYQVEDLARVLRDYVTVVEFNPKRQASVEERLILLRHLERKYGGDIADIVAFSERAAIDLAALEHSDERIAELQARESELLEACGEVCLELSRKRRAAAQELAAAVEGELDDLRMAGARFGVAFSLDAADDGVVLQSLQPPMVQSLTVTSTGNEVVDASPVRRAAFDATGMDRVEFLVAPNVGEGLKPLVRIASGGETSRLMLALKAVLSRADRTPTLIFDEIDQGIGGRIGTVVGTKLWRLTAKATEEDPGHQVLCITHLPQLAGFGDAHFRVAKDVVEGRTVTHVTLLQPEERVAELAQMLGTNGAAAVRGAHEILEQAAAAKGRLEMTQLNGC
ncbi:MAG: DNA repair protein RecN [Anaerolineae bacterium]|nr:DNA repair protein RecN [Anaerolineae bacterium]